VIRCVWWYYVLADELGLWIQCLQETQHPSSMYAGKARYGMYDMGGPVTQECLHSMELLLRRAESLPQGVSPCA
jgi:hypothetical protein